MATGNEEAWIDNSQLVLLSFTCFISESVFAVFMAVVSETVRTMKPDHFLYNHAKYPFSYNTSWGRSSINYYR